MFKKTSNKKTRLAWQMREFALNDVVKAAQRPKGKKGDSSKEKRFAAVEEKGFKVGGYACILSDPTPLKILEITDAGYLKLEGFKVSGIESLVTPCTALPAGKPKKHKRM